MAEHEIARLFDAPQTIPGQLALSTDAPADVTGEPVRKTYRERREAKAARLIEWAEKREAKSDAMHAAADSHTAGIPLGQPILVGHHSQRRHERAIERGWAATGRAFENDAKAAEMRRKAERIEAAASQAIYSDDPDAAERLAEKIAGLEAQREEMKARNAAFKKANKDRLKAMGSAYERNRALPHPSYELQNLGGNLSRLRKRLADMQ